MPRDEQVLIEPVHRNVVTVGHEVDRAERAEVGQHIGQALHRHFEHGIHGHDQLRAEVFRKRRNLVHLRYEPIERFDRSTADLLADRHIDEELPEES